MVEVFFSYSHKDDKFRDELEKHLSILKRQGVINVWHDRCIGAGHEFGSEINQHLERASIILLLVSSDFLASEYCYEKEMQRAMERHEAGQARVIPVILRPCAWQDAPFGKLLAVPKDGKPISQYPSIDEALLEVTQTIRAVAQEVRKSPESQPTTPRTARSVKPKWSAGQIASDIRSSNLRAKRKPTDEDRERFLDEGFEYVAKFFENSLAELEKRNRAVSVNYRKIDSNSFSAKAYSNGEEVSRCKIRLRPAQLAGMGITYSSGQLEDNSFNEALTVVDDGYTLSLKPMGMAFGQNRPEGNLTHQGASEYLWGLFMEPLQR